MLNKIVGFEDAKQVIVFFLKTENHTSERFFWQLYAYYEYSQETKTCTYMQLLAQPKGL